MINPRRCLLIIVSAVFLYTSLLPAQAIPDARVRYVSAGAVYLDRGGSIGLKVGDRLDVVRNNEVIARIEVTYLATASASCKIISQQGEIQAGDVARWIEHTSEEAVTDTTTEVRTREIPVKRAIETKTLFRTFISGGFSVQWYHRTDKSPAGMDFNQWNARLNLRIRNLWAKDLYLNINTRARYDQRSYASGVSIPAEEWRSRIYWITFAYEPADAPFNFQVGRIASNKFSGLGYLDGLILQHNVSRSFNWGVFGGVQPDMQSIDFSTDMQKYGVYGSYRYGAYDDTYLQTTLAVAGSYSGGTVNREYAYFEIRINDKSGWRLNNSLELDFNRDWRKEYSGTSLSLSSFYLSGSYKFNDRLTAGLGYDNRKNYLTYVYYSRPQELFNETQRQSLRGDVWIKVPADMTISLRAGGRQGKDESQISYNYGVTLLKSNLFKYFQATLAFTGFRNIYNHGYSPSASVRYQLGAVNTGVSYGAYRYIVDRYDENRLNQYVNLTFSIPVWSKIYLFGHYYYDWGDDMEGHRILTELGYRF